MKVLRRIKMEGNPEKNLVKTDFYQSAEFFIQKYHKIVAVSAIS